MLTRLVSRSFCFCDLCEHELYVCQRGDLHICLYICATFVKRSDAQCDGFETGSRGCSLRHSAWTERWSRSREKDEALYLWVWPLTRHWNNQLFRKKDERGREWDKETNQRKDPLTALVAKRSPIVCKRMRKQPRFSLVLLPQRTVS